jgi:Tfp pilus assembly protein FimT
MTTRESLGRWWRRFGQAGFTVSELFVVIGLVGVLTAISTPFFLSFIRASTLRAGAEEMTTALHRARQLAIKDNRSMCVENSGGRVRYRVGTCTGTIWTGPGTDSNGFIQFANNIGVTSGQVTFTYIGTAPLGGSYTVSNPHDAKTLSVVVVPSGRISITP